MLELEQAKKLTTVRLLKYFKKNRGTWLQSTTDEGLSETELQFKRYWEAIRNELNTREHIKTTD